MTIYQWFYIFSFCRFQSLLQTIVVKIDYQLKNDHFLVSQTTCLRTRSNIAKNCWNQWLSFDIKWFRFRLEDKLPMVFLLDFFIVSVCTCLIPRMDQSNVKIELLLVDCKGWIPSFWTVLLYIRFKIIISNMYIIIKSSLDQRLRLRDIREFQQCVLNWLMLGNLSNRA